MSLTGWFTVRSRKQESIKLIYLLFETQHLRETDSFVANNPQIAAKQVIENLFIEELEFCKNNIHPCLLSVHALAMHIRKTGIISEKLSPYANALNHLISAAENLEQSGIKYLSIIEQEILKTASNIAIKRKNECGWEDIYLPRPISASTNEKCIELEQLYLVNLYGDPFEWSWTTVNIDEILRKNLKYHKWTLKLRDGRIRIHWFRLSGISAT